MNSRNECELKAGHPPAVKAGKMRIIQHKSTHDTTNAAASDETNLLKLSTSPPKLTAISGAAVHGHADFTSEAVQKFHDKPLPTHEPRSCCMKPIIQQPKK